MAELTFLRLDAVMLCQRCGAVVLDAALHAGFHVELDQTKEATRWATP